MGQIIRCPLIGVPCMKSITIQEKTFFLAEAEKPEEDKQRRGKAINEAIGDRYKIRSALEEKGINAFTCKICEMIQTCAYGIADITQRNANVLLELGMMIALGKPTIILSKRGEEQELNLPSDLNAIEIVPFIEYIDIIDQLRAIVPKLPPPVSPPSPIDDLEKIRPIFASELRSLGADLVKQFKEMAKESKLDTMPVAKEEKIKIPPQLSGKMNELSEKLADMGRLGFVADADTYLVQSALNYFEEKYDEAFVAASRSLELEPNKADTLHMRGLILAKLGRYRESITDFSRSLELRPDDPLTLYNLACALSLQGETNEALAYLEKAIGLDKKCREDAKTDKDFDNIREGPRFKKLIESN